MGKWRYSLTFPLPLALYWETSRLVSSRLVSSKARLARQICLNLRTHAVSSGRPSERHDDQDSLAYVQ